MAPFRIVMRASLSLAAGALHQPKLAALGKIGSTWQGAYFVHRGLVMPDELAGLIEPRFVAEGLELLAQDPSPSLNENSEVAIVGSLESTRYLQNQLLRDSDWASMAHSLELRTPFVDWPLLNKLAPLVDHFQGGNGKRILAASAARPLPESIVNHRKTGFGLPLASGSTRWTFMRPKR